MRDELKVDADGFVVGPDGQPVEFKPTLPTALVLRVLRWWRKVRSVS